MSNDELPPRSQRAPELNPAAITDLARYITEVTTRNEFLEDRVNDLLAANNREVERRRALEKRVGELEYLLTHTKPEEEHGSEKKGGEG